jgi:hypothetical protein
MKKRIITAVILCASYLFAAPAFADNVIQIWACELNDGNTDEDVVEVSSTWLDAAKKVEGGEDFNVLLRFPLAANVGDGSFRFVLVVADAKTWGVWVDSSVNDADLSEANDAWSEVASCSGSSMWAGVPIE